MNHPTGLTYYSLCFLGLWIAQALAPALLHIVIVYSKVEKAEETEKEMDGS